MSCRCGWDGTGDHLCHRCHVAIGSSRLCDLRAVALAGMQVKFQAYETWGCDGCWTWYQSQFDQPTEQEGSPD